MAEKEYDVAIIGGGSAGYAAARSAAGHGLKTVVIEGGEDVGGLCILRGCMPTKAFLYSAEVAHLASRASVFGVWAQDVRADFKQVMARKDKLISEFASYRRQQLESGKFDFIRAQASFLDSHRVKLSTGGELRARAFILATGSSIAPSPLPQLDQVGYLTSDTALKPEKLPASIIVLGGGAIAVEYAQFFSRMGVHVTIIQRSAHLLKDEDTDGVIQLETALRREGIALFTGTNLVGASREGGMKVIEFEHQGQTIRQAAEEVFYALGRVPNVEGLALENTKVVFAYGRFLTDSFMQTSDPAIYAAGDCTGLHEIVHIAIQQGEIAAHNIAFPDQKRCADYRLLTMITFSDPQIARVGITEQEAIAQKVPHIAATYPFNDHGKSIIMDIQEGFVKLVADPQTGEILGGACIGPMGGELIHEIVVAMSKWMTVQELAAVPHYHPTLAEIWTYPAEELAARVNVQ